MTEEDISEIPEKDRSKYRAYAEAVLAALRAFDRANEWADLVKYLERLQKVLDKHKQFSVVPEKLLMSRRLAQCLNPSLPGGLHVKALEVLETVLLRMGPDRTARNLEFGIGLFPIFRPASMAVKAKFLAVIENCFVPLGPNLAPCLGALVLSLLPGIEEVNSEFYSKVLGILDRMSGLVGPAAFFSAVWFCLLRTPHVRMPALHYLRLRLPPPPQSQQQQQQQAAGLSRTPSFVSLTAAQVQEQAALEQSWAEDMDRFLPDRDRLVLQALVQSLQDPKMLVVRETLELIASHFRLHSRMFGDSSLRVLIGSALLLLTRKESSLSRRLFSWLIGSDAKGSDGSVPGQEPPGEYFRSFARMPTIGAIRDLFAASRTQATPGSAHSHPQQEFVLRPVRVLECLVDRDEIGSQIVDDILGDSLSMLAAHRPDGPAGGPGSHDILRQVQEFIDTVAPRRLWSFLVRFSHEALLLLVSADVPPSPEGAQLLSAVLDTLTPPSSPEEVSELVSQHLPRLLESIISALPEIFRRGSSADITRALQLAAKVMGKIPPNELDASPSSPPPPPPAAPAPDGKAAIAAPSPEIMKSCVDQFAKFFCDFASSKSLQGGDRELTDMDVLAYDLTTQLLVELHLRYSLEESSATWFGVLCEACTAAEARPAVVCLSIRAFLALVERPVGRTAAGSGLPQLCQAIARRLWPMLHHSLSNVHYDAGAFLIALERLQPDVVHTELTARMLKGPIAERIDAYQRFALLWRMAGESSKSTAASNQRPFTRALFLMLDALQHEHPDIRLTGRSWLADSADKAERVLDPLLLEALDVSTVRRDGGSVYSGPYDARRVQYVLRLLRVLFDSEAGAFAERALQKIVSKDVLALNDVHSAATPDFLGIKVVSYVDIVTVMCLRYIQSVLPDGADAEAVAANAIVQTTAAELLHRLLSRVGGAASREGIRIASVIQAPVLADMAQAVSSSNLVLQVHLLSLLRTMVQVDADDAASRDRAKQVNSQSFQHEDGDDLGGLAAAGAPHVPIMESPMFLQTLIIGLLQPPHKNLRSYWLDFLTSCLAIHPLAPAARSALLGPVIDTLCAIIESVPAASVYDSLPSSDLQAILRALSTIMSHEAQLHQQQSQHGPGGAGQGQPSQPLRASSPAPRLEGASDAQATGALSSSPTASSADGTLSSSGSGAQSGLAAPSPFSSSPSASASAASVAMPTESLGMGPGWMALPVGIVGFLKDAFVGPAPAPRAATQQTLVLLEKLALILKALFHVYGAPLSSAATAAPTSKVHSKYLIQDQVFRILEAVMHRFPTELVRAMLPMWSGDPTKQRLCLEILNTLEAATEETVLGATSSVLSASVSASRARQRTPGPATQEERNVLDFLSSYLEQPVSVDGLCKAWPYFYSTMRTALSYLWCGDTAAQLMRLTNLYIVRVATMEEKRGKRPSAADRRERQELVQRLVESILSMVGQHQLVGFQAPPAEEPLAAPTEGSEQQPQPAATPPPPELSLDILRGLGALFLPVLDAVFDEKERDGKLVPLLATLIHQLVPLTRLRGLPHAEAVTRFIVATCAYPYAMRAWRKDVWDSLHDADFFTSQSEAAPASLLALWATPVNHLMTNDKMAYADLLRNVGKSLQMQPSIFVREHEGLNRGRHLRRLAFAIFSGSVDQYIRSLPVIKERVVDAFKLPNTPLLQCQAFLCLRVLFTRFSPANLLSFLPVVLTELLLALSIQLPPQPPTSQLYAEVLLGACKLVDTMLLLSDANFAIHQWLFVSEQSRPRIGLFRPLLERIAALPDTATPLATAAPAPAPATTTDVTAYVSPRQSTTPQQPRLSWPLITVRSLSEQGALQQLKQLLAKYSDAVRDFQVQSLPPDMEAISQVILNDFTFVASLSPGWVIVPSSSGSGPASSSTSSTGQTSTASSPPTSSSTSPPEARPSMTFAYH